MIYRYYIYFACVFVWTLFTAQQCQTTDACGSYSYEGRRILVTPVLYKSYSSLPKPVTQLFNGVSNVINIQGSLWYLHPTVFGIKVESYAQCNGVPRFISTCCIKKDANSCYLIGDENIYQLSVFYRTNFKCKVTIRAITSDANYDSYPDGTYLYEGSFDIDANSTIENSYCTLQYIKTINQIDDYCNFIK